MTRRQIVKFAILSWFAAGFLMGGVESCNDRYPCGYHVAGTSGCVYESYASYLMPGRILACELFRKRFERESPLP